MDDKIRRVYPSPLNNANFISKLFVNWVSPLLKLGKQRPLEEEDLYSPIPDEECKFLTDQLEKEWNKELKKPSPSLSACFIRLYWLKMTFLTLILAIEEVNRILFPIFIQQILRYFEGTANLMHAISFASYIAIGVTVNCIVHHPFFLELVRIGFKMRIASSGLLYKKAFKLNMSGSGNNLNGQLLNMLSNDGTKLEYIVYFMSYLIVSPLESIAIVIILVKLVDVSILSGLIIIGISIPIQSLVGKIVDKLRRKVSQKCDKRIGLISEIFNGIKIIKMYCWEEPFKKMVELLRADEMKYQKLLYVVSVFNGIVDLILPSLITFTSVTFFIFFTNRPLIPSYIVLAMSFYMRISQSMGFFFIKALTFLIGGKVSLKRMENDESLTLKNMSFEVTDGKLLGVIGPVGSGKSSLLLSLLDELQKMSGEIDIKGSLFYVPQEPWIFTASLKQNILFGKPYDKKKFDEIIKVCCLDEDLKTLSNGENTIIGEKGINLSGGQRARVSVARALYSDSQIYLFDDPLSAVDFNVAKKLYENCINKYLKSKIKILVTHQVHHLASNANEILYLEDGEIKFRGSYSELISSGVNMEMIEEQGNEEVKSIRSIRHSKSENYLSLSRKSLRSNRKSVLDNTDRMSIAPDEHAYVNPHYLPDLDDNTDLNDKDELNKNDAYNHFDESKEFDEKRTFGAMSWKTYFNYFRAGGGLIGACFSFFVYVASAEDRDMINQLTSSNSTINGDPSNETTLKIFSDRKRYYIIYSILIVCAIIIGKLRVALFYTLSARTAISLHKEMFEKVLKTNIRFFDTNPIGRIINRFSKDIGFVDDLIPSTVGDFMIVLMMVLGSVSISLILNYWIIIPTIPLTVLFIYIRKYFLATSMEIKRIEGIVRSPIFVHVNNTLSGMTIIRAANMEEILNEEFYVHTDYHTRANSAFVYVNRWLGVRLDWVATIFTFIALFSCIILREWKILNLTSGDVGLMLVYLLQLVGLFQWTVRQSCEVENLMTSVERVFEYCKLETEPLEIGHRKPPSDWPSKGEIKFEDVSFRYDKNLSYVLNNINIKIKSGEKIGIVGRTGAGKSSIIQTLFRMAEPDGSLIIDDLNIKELSLHDLRSKLSIIPQEPTLFIGTIRTNLDPLNQYTDHVLWDALEQVQLKDAIREMKDGLESEVHKAGSNLSVGQKQLICLARALIKKSKILIIDEATANVDFKTDALVQDAIRECFKDCTVITIAHRLHTIIDNDRILCLSQGKVQNFGRPYELIEDETSILHDLVNALDKQEREKLIEMAKKAYKPEYLGSKSSIRSQIIFVLSKEKE
nr:ATP-binding cassette subfamily C4-4-2 [Brachionus rubens]